MAKQRFINTRIWDDTWFVSLTAEQKLIFLYLLTNPATNIAGCYEITPRRIAYDTSLKETIALDSLSVFEKQGKIVYRDGWLLIVNFIKHQSNNPKIKAGIKAELSRCPDWVSDRLSKPMDSPRYDTNNYNSNLNSNSSSKEEEKKKKKSSKKPETLITRPDLKSDTEYLVWLAQQKKYASFDVKGKYNTMLAWCEKNKQTPSRQRLITWLNKEVADVPIKSNGHVQTGCDICLNHPHRHELSVKGGGYIFDPETNKVTLCICRRQNGTA